MKIKRFLSLLLALVMCLSLAPAAFAEDPAYYTLSVSGTYDQSGARSMLDMVNALRTGEDAWQLDENGEVVYLPDLEELQYSYALEEIAMQRAIEVALSFSHTRPNGERCFSCVASDGTRSWGENIAAGYTTVSGVFEGWCETDKNYAGQGHRRNMLKDGFQCIGIAHVVYGGTHYWVQEFSWYNEPGTECPPPDETQEREVEVAASNVTQYGTAEAEPADMSLTVGETAAAPQASARLMISGAWGGVAPTARITPDWESADESVVTVENGQLTAVGAGETSLSAQVFGGQSLSVSVQVQGSQPVAKEAEINGCSLSLKGFIVLNFYVQMPESLLNDEGAYVILDGDKYLISAAETREQDGILLHRFSVPLPAKEMNRKLNLQVFDGEGDPVTLVYQGVDYTETGYEYAVQDYLDKVMAASDALKLLNLVRAMNDYGSCAQLYFAYDADNRRELLCDPGSVTVTDLKPYQPETEEAEDTGLHYEGATLLLRSGTILRHWFTLKRGEIEDYRFVLDGEELSPIQKDGKWYVEKTDIRAKDLDEALLLTVTEKGSTVLTARYSPLSYVYKVLSSGKATADLELAVKALFRYWEAAEAYFG